MNCIKKVKYTLKNSFFQIEKIILVTKCKDRLDNAMQNKNYRLRHAVGMNAITHP